MASRWTAADIPDLDGERYLITGANSGIGYYAAVELARHGGVVLMACRDRTRGVAALSRLRKEASGPKSRAAEAELLIVDLASLDSVHEAADRELQRALPLRCLINNAGVMAPKKRLTTQDGFELQFGTNVLAHFALTCRLMPLLELARAARVEDAPRIVTVASIAHKTGKLHFDDLQATRSYSPMASYQQSKLADLMFAFELERRLRVSKLGAISLAVHPGVANTNLFQTGKYSAIEKTMRSVASHVIGALLNDEPQGALPTLYAAAAEGLAGGGYYGPQGFLEMRGGDVGTAKIARRALDRSAAARLWDVCEELTGVRCLDLSSPGPGMPA